MDMQSGDEPANLAILIKHGHWQIGLRHPNAPHFDRASIFSTAVPQVVVQSHSMSVVISEEAGTTQQERAASRISDKTTTI